MGEHKEACYIERHGKSWPGKLGDYCNKLPGALLNKL